MKIQKWPFIFISALLTACSGSSDSQPQSVRFDLSNAQALIVGNSSNSATLTLHSFSEALTTDEAISNLRKLVSDGSIQQAIFSIETSSGNKTVKYPVSIYRLNTSPTGEIYVSFDFPGVIFEGNQCYLAIITEANQVSCVTDRFTENIYFNLEGDAYLLAKELTGQYGIGPEHDILKWSPRNSTVQSLFNSQDARKIDFSLASYSGYRPAPDGSLILIGGLLGTSSDFFRYYPASGTLTILNNDLPVSNPSEAVPTVDTFDILANNKVYVATDKGLYIGTFSPDNHILFTMIPDHPFSFQCQNRCSFVLRQGDEAIMINENLNEIYRVDPGLAQFALPDINIELFHVSGDFVYVSGADSSGKFKFIRKQLIIEGNGEETDLLAGQNLLVQEFDVADNGDVYFGALDLNTTTVFLYKYNNSTGELEQLQSLPGDLMQIVLLQGGSI